MSGPSKFDKILQNLDFVSNETCSKLNSDKYCSNFYKMSYGQIERYNGVSKELANKQNIDKFLTIGIKTFLRPHCLKECIESIRKYYKNIEILVADDSTDDVKKINKDIIDNFNQIRLFNFNQIRLFDLPYDSGLSKGRNHLVNNTKTPYYLVLDDSRQLSESTDLIAMVNFLITSKYNLIAGICSDRSGENSHYTKKFVSYRYVDDIPVVKTKEIIKNEPIKNQYLTAYDTNQTLNIFIAETDKLKKFKWNPLAKLGEHELFFFQWWKNNLKCAVSFDINFNECKNKKYLKNGTELRSRANNVLNPTQFVRFE